MPEVPCFDKIKYASTTLFLVSVISFPRSYLVMKLVLLSFFLFTHLLDVYRERKVFVYRSLLGFYLFIALGGALWSLIGAINDGHLVGINDSFRLYVIWSMAFLIIFTLLRAGDEINLFQSAIILSGLLISVINFYALYDVYYKVGLISNSMREELELGIGIHEGYIRINSHNIGSLFIVTPYLLSLQFRRDSVIKNPVLAKISLLFCLVLTAISGRRALWICIALTPAIIFALSYISGTIYILKKRARSFIYIYVMLAVFALGWSFISPKDTTDVAFLDHLNQAFSAQDERSIQKSYLLESFLNSPLIGSGLGVSAIVPRNLEAPWLYEATYFQLLFNLGILGTIYLTALFSYYIYLSIMLIKLKVYESHIAFCYLVSFLSLLIGAYSNPYLASFDFLIYIGILPLLTSYQQRFTNQHADQKLYNS